MKKLILILTLIVLSLKVLGQDIKTDEYKDYKPCTQCLDKWKHSNSSDYAPTGSPQRSNDSFGGAVKNQGKKIGQFFAVLIGGIATVIIYKKVDNEINKVN